MNSKLKVINLSCRYLSIVSITSFLMIIIATSSAVAELGQSYREAERLPINEKIQLASDRLNDMKASLTYALKELKNARTSKDPSRINCIRNELSTIKGLLRISDEAFLNIQEASAINQTSLINHEYVKIKMAAERTKELKVQIGNKCSGDNDPMLINRNIRSEAEISDKAVQEFQPTTDDSTVIIYDPIATERPESISASE